MTSGRVQNGEEVRVVPKGISFAGLGWKHLGLTADDQDIWVREVCGVHGSAILEGVCQICVYTDEKMSKE